ncbi:hypothetical protein AVEN_127843-1 [Araneus ventricosus]|uniref:Uncharacterized protein n=1 Tax=Araneus ventricosus TaxID=182803 RepID=A0A4Y1ZZF5_ARAVE|nr:hypothetical protein AVEN_127843-1 [Araneus ventricosus]
MKKMDIAQRKEKVKQDSTFRGLMQEKNINLDEKGDFEEELADGTLFEGETRWIWEESPERTTKVVLSSLGDDGLKRRRS